MILIRCVRIKDFRSISEQEVMFDEGYLPIVGPNNSGKSNFLRALNLFFNEEVEPGVPLRLQTDFHNPGRNKKKEITVEVDFDLPDAFKYRKNLEQGLNETLGREFSVRKVYSLSGERSPSDIKETISVRKSDDDSYSEVDDEGAARVRQFLNLIRFRYQPNHVHPSEILKSEEPELQSALIFQLNRAKDVSSQDLKNIFARMGVAAKDLLAPISDDLKKANPHIEALELSLPEELGDLLFSFVPSLRVRGGEQFAALQHGSGVQSYLTYLMLAFLDTRFDSKFGWQQATIWAIEEPESFLHQDLQHELAAYLAQFAKGERVQVLTTTHSDVFIRYSGRGVLCELTEGRTASRTLPSRQITGEAARIGVSPFVHPLLFSSQRPLLLVEGKTDRMYLEMAYRKLRRPNPWAISDVQGLDPSTDLQGIDGLTKYLAANRPAVRTRALGSPCFVVVDWNENDKTVGYVQKELDHHPTSRAIQIIDSEINEDLGRSFTGLERSLSTRLIREAEAAGHLKTLRPSDSELPLILDKGSMDKVALANFADDNSTRDDLQFLAALLDRLEGALLESEEEARRVEAGDFFPAD